MMDAFVGCQELAIERWPFWGAIDVLLQHATNCGDGSVDSERECCPIHRLNEHGGIGKSVLCFLEGIRVGVRPLEGLHFPWNSL